MFSSKWHSYEPSIAKEEVNADDIRAEIEKIIRVDHAGEYGARRIYAGQLAAFPKETTTGKIIAEMDEQEEVHLRAFNDMIFQYRVRPTVLLPFWHATGWLLGYGTAILGKESAMACTVAVETEIGDHYNSQLRFLQTNDVQDDKLKDSIKSFRDDELHHLDTGIQHNAERTVLYSPIMNFVRTGTKVAIWLAKRY